MNGAEFRNTILEQIKMYLNGEITKEYFYNLVEPFYTEYASTYDNSKFHHIFLSTIADACLIYIDEPGLTADMKEKLFYKTVDEAYKQLIIIK